MHDLWQWQVFNVDGCDQFQPVYRLSCQCDVCFWKFILHLQERLFCWRSWSLFGVSGR